MFHPFELAVCGFSGSGKTTLIERLLAALTSDLRLGYAKHSSHDFDLDRPGKDTARAAAAGAFRVFITNDRATAALTGAPVDFVQRRTMFDDCDAVLVEGWKSSPLPRIVVLDEAGEILNELGQRDGSEPKSRPGPVVAWVGRAATGPEPARPYFQRDDIAGIAACVRAFWDAQVARTPLYGLALAGGRSTRMQRDKAALEYAGRPQLSRTFELLAAHTTRTFVSARPGQWTDGPFASLPQIPDTIQNCGPAGGILSAMRAHPEAAWLVAACDLPFLDGDTLDDLVRQRAPFKVATAYTSANDGLPEPLCAIYEPRAHSRLFQFFAIGYDCPRKVLINSNVRLLTLRQARALDNVNRPEEYESARRAIGAPT